MNKFTFGQRLIILRKHFGITISEMSENLGAVKSNISRYERDMVKPTICFLESLVKVYRVNLNWLFGENQNMLLTDGVKSKKMTKNEIPKSKHNVIEISSIDYTTFGIPVFYDLIIQAAEMRLLPVSGSISAGEPMEITLTDFDYVPLPTYKSSKDLDEHIAFRVNGLSMAPEIHHEDIVFIYKNENWIELNNKIVAVRIHGEVTLKKLSIDNRKREIALIALNKMFEDINIGFEMMESTTLVGELKAIIRINKKY